MGHGRDFIYSAQQGKRMNEVERFWNKQETSTKEGHLNGVKIGI
jgi:hypothetical protein